MLVMLVVVKQRQEDHCKLHATIDYIKKPWTQNKREDGEMEDGETAQSIRYLPCSQQALSSDPQNSH